MAKLNIETSQNVILEFKIAGIGERIAAQIIDYLIYFGYFLIVIWLADKAEVNGRLFWMAASAPVLFYPLITEALYDGQTLGKMLLKIKVVRMDGMPVTFGNYLIRWILSIVDVLLFSGLIAIFVIILNGKGQRIGDILAGTTVINIKEKTSLDDTILSEFDLDYQMQFSQVELLSQEDIDTVKDVMLHVKRNSSNRDSVILAYKAKKALEQKMGISTQMKASAFFKVILKDYNYFHAR